MFWVSTWQSIIEVILDYDDDADADDVDDGDDDDDDDDDDDTWQSIVEVILLLLQGSMPRPLNLNFPLFHF